MMKKLMALLTAALMLAVMLPLTASAETYPTPAGYNDNDYQKLVAFFETENEDGVKNGVVAFGDGYDPADPETWKGNGQSIEWTDVDGELRVVSMGTSRSSLYGALDLSGCAALEELYCSGNNLTELDVSGCTALDYLGCYENNLTELDVTQYTALEYLECSGNNLTELDVTQNTELDSLFCGRNNLTRLDVTKNTKLWRLDCSGNNITELDLTNQTELQYLYSSSTIENIEFIWFGTQYHVYAEGNGYVEINGSAEENQDFEMEEILTASARPMDGYAFLGWYDAEGNLVSTEDEIDLLTIGETTLEARFEETDDPTDPTDPEGDISAEANEYGEVQYVHNEEDDSLTLNMTASDEAYGVRNIYINGVLVATTSEDTYVIDNISSYADENGNIEIYVEFAQSEGGEEPIDPDDPPKTGTASMVGMAIGLMLIGAAIVLIRRRQTAR